MADRLSASGRFTVLLVKEGPIHNGFIVDMPKGFGKLLFDDTLVSRFATEPENGTSDRPESWPVGAMTGESSAIKSTLYTCDNLQDYHSLCTKLGELAPAIKVGSSFVGGFYDKSSRYLIDWFQASDFLYIASHGSLLEQDSLQTEGIAAWLS